MHLSTFLESVERKRAALAITVTLTALGVALSARGSAAPIGGSAEYAPERPIAALTIDRSADAYVAAMVASAGARYLPLRGQPLPQVSNATLAQIGADARSTSGLLHYYGGPTVASASIYNIYVNNSASYWGDPGTFLTNWSAGGSTTFLHVLDQYTKSTTNGRYRYGGGINVSYNTSKTLGDQDMYNIIHPVAKKYGTGYKSIYHVYFIKGVKQCSSTAGGCYAVQYCAYHGSVNFSDIGHTIYSFEGYQNFSGCGAPSGTTSDATDSTMSHEMYEAITDPDVNNGTLAWYNSQQGEIGDICRSNYGFVTLNAVKYDIQEEYSNKYARCTFAP